jgi:hypothetical protein
MTSLLVYLAEHRAGIFVLIAIAGVICVLAQWVAWIFGLGRFARTPSPGTRPLNPLRYVVVDLFVQIINDFRHLLALVVVTMFAVTLGAAMWPGLSSGDVELLKDGLQAVAAALAGLIGSIIGYYFGESAATRREPPSRAGADGGAPVQAPLPPGGVAPAVRPAQAPPKPIEEEPL